MENPSNVDVSIRNVDVRLKESLVGSNLNGDCVNSIYIASAIKDETQITHFNEENVDKSSPNLPNLVGDFSEKLHICTDSSNCGLLNGCHKTIHEDMQRVDLSVNGINKCSNFDILNSHLDHRTCEQSKNCVEDSKIDYDTIDKELTSSGANSSLSSESSTSSRVSDCDDQVTANHDAQLNQIKNVISSNRSGGVIPSDVNISYLGYESESQMPDIMRLIQKDLSEPYSIYTYRYFIHNWPKLCFLAQYKDHCVGAIVCKLDVHKKQSRRGYIAMLAVDEKYRKQKIGSNLVLKAIQAMVEDNADEVVLETEITNRPALKLYENLGFVRDKRLFRYYLNGVDALRLKLWLR